MSSSRNGIKADAVPIGRVEVTNPVDGHPGDAKPTAAHDTNLAVDFVCKLPCVQLTAIAVDPVTKKKGAIATKFFPQPMDREALHKWIEDRQGNSNIYYLLNPLLRPMDKKPERADIAQVIAFHVDLDPRAGEAQETAQERIGAQLAAYRTPPSAIVNSGGGVQAIWLLEQPIQIDGDLAKAEDAKLYNVQLERELGGDACHNIDRILRVPGTTNVAHDLKLKKGRHDAPATILSWTGKTYPLSAFAKAAPPAVPSGSAPAAATNEPKGAAPVNLDDIKGLRGWVRQHIVLGHDPDGLKVYPSRSEGLFAVACELVRADADDATIRSIIMDPSYAVSASVLDKKNPIREAHRTIGRAREKVANSTPIFVDTYGKEKLPKATYRNARAALLALDIPCSKDVFHNKYLIGWRGDHKHAINVPYGEYSEDVLRRVRQIIIDEFRFDPGEKSVLDAVLALCGENQFDPVADYLDEVQAKWDGVPRLDTWLTRYAGAEDTPLIRAFGAIHMIASVRRVRQPGCKYDTTLILEGKQGTQKTNAIRVLAGPENFSDQTILGVRDREAQENMAGIWLYEIAELTGIHKAEIDRVKAWASRTHDRARPAFGRALVSQPRRCTCWGTVNDDGGGYLRDQTGNRRFWPVNTRKIDIDALRADRDQLWAEAATRDARRESIVLDERLWDAARVEQDARTESDPWEDALASIPHEVNDYRGRPVTIVHEQADGEWRLATSDLLSHVLHLPVAQQTSAHGKRLSPIMLRLGWQRNKSGLVYIEQRAQRGYYLPAGDVEAYARECRAGVQEPLI